MVFMAVLDNQLSGIHVACRVVVNVDTCHGIGSFSIIEKCPVTVTSVSINNLHSMKLSEVKLDF